MEASEETPMKLRKEYRDALAKELRQCADLIETEPDPLRKLYFFSAAYGSTNRILNLEYDEQLSLVDLVLTLMHGKMAERGAAIQAGDKTIPEFTPDLFEILPRIVRQMGDAIQKQKDIYPILERGWKLAYTTTGNGFYLWKKGALKL